MATERVRRYATAAAIRHNVGLRDVLSPCRVRAAVRARWEVMRALSADGFNTSQIGRMLERDHSTVVHGLRQADIA